MNTPTPSEADSSRSPMALGLCLGTREAGFALCSRERLVRSGIWTLRKIPSQQGREARLRAELGKLLDGYQPGRIALASLDRQHQQHPMIQSVLAWISIEARSRNVLVFSHDRAEVRAATLGDATARPTHRTLAAALARQFPELARLTPAGALPPATAVPLPPFATHRERYWQRMFLALAIALYALRPREIRDVTPTR